MSGQITINVGALSSYFSSAAKLAADSVSSAAHNSSLFKSSGLSANYNFSTAQPPQIIEIGIWRVQQATHKVNGKVVSVWVVEKSALTGGGALEMCKKEVSSLSRLRHPAILEIVEPLEESRSSLSFATEPVTCSLRQALAFGNTRSHSGGSGSSSQDIELDEVEIQKGLLHVGKALQFLHDSAKIVHSNLTPEAIIINGKGDWKLSAFGFSTTLQDLNGNPPKWEFPEQDFTLPPSMSKNIDYLAPEFLLDEWIGAPNDMYALGCVIHAIHSKGSPPFSCRQNVNNLRENLRQLEHDKIGLLRSGWRAMGTEVQDVLSHLLTLSPSSRLSASAFQTSSYFNSLLVSTLKFLDRDTFNSKTLEEQTSFMKGLVKIINQFSDKVVRRKILPSLLEETRKHQLVPFIIPNIVVIVSKMTADDFRDQVLPQLKGLFTVKEPPQVPLSMLDTLPVFQEKTSPVTFREEIMPLVYGCLESEIPPVLEKALKIVPTLSESLDYTTLKQILFPKITTVFAKTTLLSVKVNTLMCFYAMIKTLDKFTLTEKLVPLLSKIKTKEPAVMLATLAVYEEMSQKIDIEAIATMILPQLWTFSIGPLLNADQFAKFMGTIKKLSHRVEDEHSRHLKEVMRLEESAQTRMASQALGKDGEINFEALVKGVDAEVNNPVSNGRTSDVAADPWGAMDGANGHGSPRTSISNPGPSSSPIPARAASPMRLGRSSMADSFSSNASSPSIFPTEVRSFGSLSSTQSASIAPSPQSSIPWSQPQSQQTKPQSSFTLPPPLPASNSYTGSATANASSFTIPPPMRPQSSSSFTIPPPMRPQSTSASFSIPPPQASSSTSAFASIAPPIRPISSNSTGKIPPPTSMAAMTAGKPNYNVSIPSMSPQTPSIFPQTTSTGSAPASNIGVMSPSLPTSPPAPKWNIVSPPGFTPGSVMQPNRTSSTQSSSNLKSNWSDFDPLG
ncbi:kinase-like protein [Atractiella rhizophila]|nr:kinase-like protein [Atractiella rhizophila]